MFKAQLLQCKVWVSGGNGQDQTGDHSDKCPADIQMEIHYNYLGPSSR